MYVVCFDFDFLRTISLAFHLLCGPRAASPLLIDNAADRSVRLLLMKTNKPIDVVRIICITNLYMRYYAPDRWERAISVAFVRPSVCLSHIHSE